MTETLNDYMPSEPLIVRIAYNDGGGERHVVFEEGAALAALLADNVVFVNSRHWKDSDKGEIAVMVNCNDLFAWACADGEDLPYAEIEAVYDAWKTQGEWGVQRWCCIRRQQKPQKPAEKLMREAGIWDAVMDALPDNTMDAETQAMFADLARDRADA